MIHSNAEQAKPNDDMSQLIKLVSALAASNRALAIVALVDAMYASKDEIKQHLKTYEELRSLVQKAGADLQEAKKRVPMPESTPEQRVEVHGVDTGSKQNDAIDKANTSLNSAKCRLQKFIEDHPHIVSMAGIKAL